jgi:thioredoxin-related protein
MKQLFFLCAILFAPIAGAEERFFDQHLGDFSEELENARDENKTGVLIFFEMDECPFCYRMKTTILKQRKVIQYFKKHFLIFPVDIEGSVEIVDFQGKAMQEKDFAFKQNRVRATPVFAFFDLTGKRVARYTGPTSDVEEFMLLGKFVVDEEYKRTNFTRYKREQRKKSE